MLSTSRRRTHAARWLLAVALTPSQPPAPAPAIADARYNFTRPARYPSGGAQTQPRWRWRSRRSCQWRSRWRSGWRSCWRSRNASASAQPLEQRLAQRWRCLDAAGAARSHTGLRMHAHTATCILVVHPRHWHMHGVYHRQLHDAGSRCRSCDAVGAGGCMAGAGRSTAGA